MNQEEQKARDFIQNSFEGLANISLLSTKSEHVYTCIAKSGDSLVGVFQASCILDEAEIIVISVDPHHRRQGIAKNFLMKFFNKQCNIKNVFLEVSCENDVAISFYQEFGFHEVGVRKNYYQNPVSKDPEDAIVMKFHVLEDTQKTTNR